MKGLGKAALVCAIIFLVLAITGGIFTAVGIAQAASDPELQSQLEEAFDSLGISIQDSISIDSDEICTETANYDGTSSVVVGESVSAIDFVGLVGDIDVKRGTTQELTIKCKGNFPLDNYTTTYQEDALIPEGVEISGSDVAIPNEAPVSLVVYEDMIEVSMLGGKFSFTVADRDIEITLPASYNGSISFTDCVAEIDVENVNLDSLIFSDIAGQMDLEQCNVNTFQVCDISGEINYEGSTRTIDVQDCLGNCEFELTAGLKGESIICNNLGNVDIQLPNGSAVKLNKSDNMGIVTCNNESSSADASIIISDNMGNISIRN